jgi:hypothetical protein
LSKCQKTVESSNYGPELAVSRKAKELILELRFMLRSLGVALDEPTLILGDDITLILDTSVPSSLFKKNQYAIAYHRVREAIATKIFHFSFVKS